MHNRNTAGGNALEKGGVTPSATCPMALSRIKARLSHSTPEQPGPG